MKKWNALAMFLKKGGCEIMVKKIIYALITTLIYLIVSNAGNLFFGISKEFSWTTTLWESFFFFIFVLLLQNYRKK